jgi:transcription termination factor Rho
MLLKEIANAIAANHRGIFDRFKLMSVQKLRHNTAVAREVIASTFDREPQEHVKIVILCLQNV